VLLLPYACNPSLGDPDRQLQNDGLTRSFANLVLSLNLANKAIDAHACGVRRRLL
jgi:hypothetical protein